MLPRFGVEGDNSNCQCAMCHYVSATMLHDSPMQMLLMLCGAYILQHRGKTCIDTRSMEPCTSLMRDRIIIAMIKHDA
jgi:hypothetical protein